MNANPIRRNVLDFEPNQPHQIALKYATGRQVANGRVMFSTTDDEVFFVTPYDADEIYALQLQPGEVFSISKRVVRGQPPTIAVQRIGNQQQPVAVKLAAPAPATAGTGQNTEEGTSPSRGVHLAQPQQPQHTAISELMASSYIAAMDALLTAQQYAASKGVPFKISTMELRSCSHCIFIALSRGSLWQR
jgi:hypothetical protein